jgi:hypothetical protein
MASKKASANDLAAVDYTTLFEAGFCRRNSLCLIKRFVGWTSDSVIHHFAGRNGGLRYR